MRLRLAILAALILSTVSLYAQIPTVPVLDRVGISDLGVHPFGVYDGTNENINLQNNNLNLSIPLVSLPGRNGHDLDLRLIYDSSVWRIWGQQWITNAPYPYWAVSLGHERQFPIVAFGWHLNWPTLINNGGTVLYPNGTGGDEYTACISTSTVILSDGSRHVFKNNMGCNTTLIKSEIPVMDSEDPDGAQLNHQDFGDAWVMTLRNGTGVPGEFCTSLHDQRNWYERSLEWREERSIRRSRS